MSDNCIKPSHFHPTFGTAQSPLTHSDIADVRAELAAVRSEIQTGLDKVKHELSVLRAESRMEVGAIRLAAGVSRDRLIRLEKSWFVRFELWLRRVFS